MKWIALAPLSSGFVMLAGSVMSIGRASETLKLGICLEKLTHIMSVPHMKSDPVFSSYIGIDWSGAKAKNHAGLQLAVAKPGKAVPNGCAHR